MAPAPASQSSWDIRASIADGSGGWLRLGHRAFAVRDIIGVAVAETGPRAEGGRHPIYASRLEAALSRVGIAVHRRGKAEQHRLEIRLRDGTTAVFSTGEARELRALHSALVQQLSQSSVPASA